ncbi:MAG: hypothetical protein M3Z21_15385 [Pseudomonadota bacterium]|nr:hypothetical protein [Pseudomonadota bacterium]
MPPVESSVDPALAALAEGFAHWRQSRSNSHERIPPPLWEQAVALCQRLPLGQVARRLGLSATDLKHRCLGLPKPRAPKPAPVAEAVFVELPAAPPPPTRTPPGIVGVEVERPDGVRLRLHYEAGQPPPLAELLRAFLEPPGC